MTPINIFYNDVTLHGALYCGGVQIVGDSGEGKSFLYQCFHNMRALSKEDIQTCIKTDYNIESVIFIDCLTEDPLSLIVEHDNCLVFIDNADIVFSEHPELVEATKKGLRLYFIIIGRGYYGRVFDYQHVTLHYDSMTGVFSFDELSL